MDFVKIPLDGFDVTAKEQRSVMSSPWQWRNLLFSEGVAFHPDEKKLMREAFSLWLEDIGRDFKKRDYVELLVFVRKLKK